MLPYCIFPAILCAPGILPLAALILHAPLCAGTLVHSDDIKLLASCNCSSPKPCVRVDQTAGQRAGASAARSALADTVVQLGVSPGVPDISVKDALLATEESTPKKRNCRFLWNEVIPNSPPYSEFMTNRLPSLAQAVQCDYNTEEGAMPQEIVLFFDIDTLLAADNR